MFAVLIFSLMFVHHLSRIDPRDYKCHVENASEIPDNVSSLNIVLQAPRIAGTKGKLSRAKKMITLHCISLQRLVEVNLLYLEKHVGLTDQKPSLKSLKVITHADGKPDINHTCTATCHRRKFQRRCIIRETVFLTWVSNCTLTAKPCKPKVSAEGVTLLPMHPKNQTLNRRIPITNGKDMLNRQKLRIIFKVLTSCIMLAFLITYIMFVIYKIVWPMRNSKTLTQKDPTSSSLKPTHEKLQTPEELLHHLSLTAYWKQQEATFEKTPIR